AAAAEKLKWRSRCISAGRYIGTNGYRLKVGHVVGFDVNSVDCRWRHRSGRLGADTPTRGRAQNNFGAGARNRSKPATSDPDTGDTDILRGRRRNPVGS